MSSHHETPVAAPAAAPALIAFILGVPTMVFLALAVILNWGR